MLRIVVLAAFCFYASALHAQGTLGVNRPLPVVKGLKSVAAHPHDPQAFTQGLIFENGFLYESTGLYGQSTLRRVEPKTGKVLRQVSVPKQYFAEGLERIGDQLFLLTWREGHCFIFDKNTFAWKGSFPYSGEGWGLAFDGTHLIMSDGSAYLSFRNPKDFKQKRRVQVTYQDEKTKKTVPVTDLNELEFIRGEIWANVWQTYHIVRIDPKTGNVLGWLDCTPLLPEQHKDQISQPAQRRENVLNGIAFDPATGTIYLTGKNWPVLYEMQLDDNDFAPRKN